MRSFDTTIHPFLDFDDGFVKSRLIAEALAEVEVGFEYQSTRLAYRQRMFAIKFKQDLEVAVERLSSIRKSPPHQRAALAVSKPELTFAYELIEKTCERWKVDLAEAANTQKWRMLSLNKTPLFGPHDPQGKVVFMKVEDVIAWLDRNGQGKYKIALKAKLNLTVRALTRMAGVVPQQEEVETPVRNWPWGRHNTKLLEVLLSTANRFWALYDPLDPSTHVKKEKVLEYIATEFPDQVSTHIAGAIATILRADGLRTGRPRKYD